MRKRFRTAWIFFSGIFLIACLESPDSPKINSEPISVSICAFQRDSSCTVPLQLSPRDSFSLYAKISSKKNDGELFLRWILDDGKILADGAQFSTDSSNAPDSLILLDSEGNRLGTFVEYLFDNAPKFNAETAPADGDTLVGDSTFAFRFAYSATDADEGDTLRYTVVWDSVSFYAGTQTELFQSGFSPGLHTFWVIVEDPHGQSDTSKTVRFVVSEEFP